MRKLTLALGVLVGIVVLSSPSFALKASDSTAKTFYNQVLVSSPTNGNTAFVTASTPNGTLLSASGVPITGLIMSGGASGGVVTIYDANVAQMNIGTAGYAEVGAQECVFEATVAANTSTFIDLSSAPISTTNGVVAMASSTSSVVVYSSSAVVANH